MDHPERDRGQRLDHEVPVAHRVERVRGHAVEAELLRGRFAIEWVTGPRERAGAQRRDIGPSPRVREAAAVALGHLDIREQMMREEHRLGRLDVGRAGQDGRAVPFREVDERSFEVDERGVQSIDRAAQPESKVRRHLVVARPPGMELASDRADPGGERALEVHVDVLERRVPVVARGHLVRESLESGHQLVHLVGGQEPGATEPAHVGDRAREVVRGELAVESRGERRPVGRVANRPPELRPLHGARELGHPRVVLLRGESAAQSRIVAPLPDRRREHVPQSLRRFFGGEVALDLGEQLVSDHELRALARSSGG